METLITLAWIVVPFSVIGIVVGWFAASFFEGRGGLQPSWSVVAGVIGSFTGGFVSPLIVSVVYGPGPAVFVGAMLGAAVGALVLIVAVMLVKRVAW